MEKVPVTAAGGVLFRKTDGQLQVLLIFRRGVWDIPKGKVEGEESIVECARREVSEEVGIPLPEVSEKLIKTYHEYEEKGKYIGKTTHWFAMPMTTDHELNPQQAEGITGLRWTSLVEAKKQVGYENLRSVLSSFEEWITENPL